MEFFLAGTGNNWSNFPAHHGPEEVNFWWPKSIKGFHAFRVLVTDAYQRRCAVTGAKTLPVLEAAHIKPYAQSGPNSIQNGLLRRFWSGTRSGCIGGRGDSLESWVVSLERVERKAQGA